MNSILRITTESSFTGKRRVGYFKAGWTDNNLPLVGPKSRTLVMSTETAEKICANVRRRIDDNGGAIWTGRGHSSIVAIAVENL